MSSSHLLRVVVDSPLPQAFDYLSDQEVADGALVWVPFGRGDKPRLGVVVGSGGVSSYPLEKIKSILGVIEGLPPLSSAWRALCEFASGYYHHPLGEVMVSSLPKNLRVGNAKALVSAWKKIDRPVPPASAAAPRLTLSGEQAAALEAINATTGFGCHLLHGITGSGKTEVYLQACAALLEREPEAQVLFLAPEINLTAPFLDRIKARFPSYCVAVLHSQLSEGQRLQNWLLGHSGRAQIMLGTRMAVMASLPTLRLIVVDEEHDPSYKQQEGWHYSARDLAVWRAKQLGIAVVLGSATPSLETWYAQSQGRYRYLALTERALGATLPTMRIVDVNREKSVEGLSPALVAAIRERLERGEQSLLFVNRRGYAPVLCCEQCGWISKCPHCVAMQVFHKSDQRLHCHLCSTQSVVPRACPSCGNRDLQTVGRGTQRVEEAIAAMFPTKPSGAAVRVLRIDADSTRRKGSAGESFAQVHRGEVDILVGTQMVSKGHDFDKLTLVGVLQPDSALFSADFRAPERLFSQLLQVAGRAGRRSGGGEVLIQTRYPDHPFYDALIRQDYAGFANALLLERQAAMLPPYGYFALLRAQGKAMPQVLAFLHEAKDLLPEAVQGHDPVPMQIARIADVDRAQLLVESRLRPRLQEALKVWLVSLQQIKTPVRWQIEVDPLEI